MAQNFPNIFSAFLLIILTVQTYSQNVQKPNEIVLFEDYAHKGKTVTIDISKCTNVPKEMEGKVTATDTKSLCVRFYNGKDCSGNISIEMMPRSPAHHFLGDWNFNDLPLSAGPCRDQCDVSVTGPVPPAEGINVTIYDQRFYQGVMETINVQGCTLIPRKFRYRVNTVNTTDGKNCFQLYNNVDCTWNRTAGQDTIELRQGTPYHDNIARWHINEVKAISHCSIKCQKDGKDKPKESKIPAPENENEIIIFDEPNFKGNYLRVLLDGTHCTSLDHFDGWEGAAKSVKLFGNMSCVVLHTTHDCKEDPMTLKLNLTLNDLATRNFSAVTRSISVCDIEGKGKPAIGLTHVSKAKAVSRWTMVSIVVGGVVLALAVILVVVKWRNPTASVFYIFRRNERNNGWSQMRL